MRDIQVEIFVQDGYVDLTHTFILPIDVDEFHYEFFDKWSFDCPRYYEVRSIDLGFINNVEEQTLDTLNNLYYKFEELESVIQDNYEELCLQHFNSFDDLYENKDNLTYYGSVSSAEELGMKFLINGNMGDIPEEFYRFVNFEELGRHIEQYRKLIKVEDGMFEIR